MAPPAGGGGTALWRELSIPGAWEVVPELHEDGRGVNVELFKASAAAAATGRDFTTAQVNGSVSKAGVLRGVHFSVGPDGGLGSASSSSGHSGLRPALPSAGRLAGGQEKYVTAVAGSAFDVVVDVRPGSATFGTWEAVLLTADKRNAVLLGAGLGHAFLALQEDTAVVYLCSSEYRPDLERSVDALDPDLKIAWPGKDARGHPLEVLRSERDRAAPSLAQAVASGLIPKG